MDEVAAEVGVTKPLLYNYFGNKERLYIACMERAGDALSATIAAAVAAATDTPARRCAPACHAFFAFLDSDRAAWAVLFDETLPARGEIAERVADYRGRILDLVTDSMLGPGARRAATRRPGSRSKPSPRPLLGAAEALARWWLRTEALSRRGGRRPADRDDRAGPAPALGPASPEAEPRKPNRKATAMIDSPSRVAVIGGNRIPFARSDSAYAHASNQDMLTAALDGLVDRFGLEGERLGEVAGGAVLKHSRDRDLTRESVLSTRLAPETPAYDVQQACGTGLETTILVANKIALGQIDAGIACGVDTTSDAPIALNEDLRETLLEANRQRSTAGKLRALTGLRPGHIVPAIPRNEEPRTGLSMGEHCAIMAERMGDRPGRAGRARGRQPPQPRRRLRARLPRRPDHPLPRARARPEPAPRLRPREAGQAEAGLRRRGRDDDRRQLDAAQRRRLRRPARLRGVGEGARPAGPRLRHRGPDRRRRPRPQARRAADGARLRDAAHARPRRRSASRTSTTTRSTRPSPPRCSAR